MIQGGTLSTEQHDNTITLTLRGINIIFTEETAFLLDGDLKYITLSSANIQVYYTYLMIKEAKAKLSINKSSNELQFTITY